jgi:hypothetical protein
MRYPWGFVRDFEEDVPLAPEFAAARKLMRQLQSLSWA